MKVVVAIVVLVIVAQFLTPLLVTLFPPLGTIVVILLYVGIVAYLLGYFP
jgi:hypothetical protein